MRRSKKLGERAQKKLPGNSRKAVANRRLSVYLLNSRQHWRAKRSVFASFEKTLCRCLLEVRATELHVSRLNDGEHRQMTDFHSSLTCINLASAAAVASGGVQPIPIKAEGSATSEPDIRS